MRDQVAHNLYKRAWRKRHKAINPNRFKDENFRTHLWSCFRMRIEQYNALLLKQDNKCSICLCDISGVRMANGRRFSSIDHNHSCCPSHKSCGKCVRGILCYRCNAMLSALEDKAFYTNALKYLDDWKYQERIDKGDKD
jgi:hypothetical protein